jgi:hypothetical protein
MVCQLRPFACSLGLNNPPCICLTPRKLCVKNLWHNKQGNCWCKMAGTGIRSFAKLRRQMPRIATTWITPWQTALKWTADCQALRSGCLEYMRSSQDCGNRLSNWYFRLCQPTVQLFYRGNPRSKRRRLSQSAVHTWARSLARDWIPAPAILHRESPCLKRHIFLPCNF